MTGDVVISARGLGKKYVIGHQSARGAGYTALRDVLARSAKSAVRTTADMFRGRAIVGGDVSEEFWALKDVDFEIKRGEVVGIIGRNGAGKSTLLKILSRITEPSEGRVEIKGRVASLLEVGTGFHPELTGRENIRLNGAILGMSQGEIRRKFDEIVDFAEVERFLDTPVKRYSSGMYVRLAFAVAAHLEPEILVVDEVLAVGDAEFQKKCLGKMQDVAGQGRTVLFVSHTMSAVRQLCTVGIVLDRGRLSFRGSASGAIDEYLRRGASRYVVEYESSGDRPAISFVRIDETAASQGSLIVDIGYTHGDAADDAIGGLAIRALTGEVVWGSNGRYHSTERVAKAGGAMLRCVCNDLPIVPGTYVLSVWLARWHEDLDQKLDALTFSFGNMEQLSPSRPSSAVVGHVDWSAQWSVLDATC